jgi:hypothetical protein
MCDESFQGGQFGLRYGRYYRFDQLVVKRFRLEKTTIPKAVSSGRSRPIHEALLPDLRPPGRAGSEALSTWTVMILLVDDGRQPLLSGGAAVMATLTGTSLLLWNLLA